VIDAMADWRYFIVVVVVVFVAVTGSTDSASISLEWKERYYA